MDGLTISNAADSMSKMGGLETSRSEKLSPRGIGNLDIASEPKNETFAGTLREAIQSVDKLQKNADVSMQKIATGQSDNLHETMIATEKADIALKLMVQVRNKMIEAYHEIMRMQV